MTVPADREWYGMRPGEPNVGLKLHAEEEQGESIAYGCLIRPRQGRRRPVHCRAHRPWFGRQGVVPACRQHPRSGARGRVGDGDGRPMIVTFATCTDSIRTIPILQHDPDRPEDVMSDSEDQPENISGYRP
jgi:hypothetical protein